MIIFRQKQYSFIDKGIRFIKDLRKIDPIPLTYGEYKFLIHPYSDDSWRVSGERKKYWQELKNKLDSYYNKKGAGNLLFKLGSTYAKIYRDKNSTSRKRLISKIDNDSAIKYSYDRINKIPKRYIIDSIGNGWFGLVFNYGDDEIEKISFKGFSETEYKFYQYLINNSSFNNIFPKIRALSEDQVIMERLNTDDTVSNKLKEYRELVRKYISGGAGVMAYRSIHGGIKPVALDKMYKDLGPDHEFCKWIENIQRGIKTIFGYRKSVGDLHASNIGERPGTGEIIYFDPTI